MDRILAAALALALSAAASSHANAETYGGSDYHKATAFEQAKATCELIADSHPNVPSRECIHLVTPRTDGAYVFLG